MPTNKDLYKYLVKQLTPVCADLADQEARIILEHYAEINWSDLITKSDEEVTSLKVMNIEKVINQRLENKPLSKIIGSKEFWGRTFKTSESVLDPRPDSECLIDVALKIYKRNPPKRILDLGTGSGCILLTLLAEFPETTGLGVDLSSEALAVAKHNAEQLHLNKRSEFIESSWLTNINHNEFDLIVSNPPYIKSNVIPNLALEVQKYDPILALDGGNDGLDCYKLILEQIKTKIISPCRILFEIGFDQEKDMMRLIEESPFTLNSVHRDLSGNPRVVDISSGDK